MANGRNQSVNKMSPRQKMINLMYIVLTAMLALNVSSDVLNGFSQVADSLERSNRIITARNQGLYLALQQFNEKNPVNGKKFLAQATDLRAKSDMLYSYIDSLKFEIVKEADGENADVHNIINRDDLEAAAHVMLTPGTGRGPELRAKIDAFRTYVTGLINDKYMKDNIAQALSTDNRNTKGGENGEELSNKKWEEAMFENMPTIAAVTMLSKLQNDIRYAEGQVLNHMLSEGDEPAHPEPVIENITPAPPVPLQGDSFEAFVCPQSSIVMKGSRYSADIVMAAIDESHRPVVVVNGQRITNGHYEVGASTPGTHNYSGYVTVTDRNGKTYKREFQSSYTVVEPMATIQATMMNVFYAGIDNPVSIGVGGVPGSNISATMTNGTLTKSGNGWVARCSKVGAECEISVSAEVNGKRISVGSTKFRVRKLPDPLPYLSVGDNRFKGGRIAKASLMGASGVGAAIDDGILDIKYHVVSFETVFFDSMGNAMPEVSSGGGFSERQRAAIKNLKHGKRFYISRIKASGPDGITRDLPPLEIIVN
ncbi:MAG: gliding motility protein GldM [Muribaculaceae bacterium]|nr:gliding motility protein GldM [Muribaculaceae bacterium]